MGSDLLMDILAASPHSIFYSFPTQCGLVSFISVKLCSKQKCWPGFYRGTLISGSQESIKTTRIINSCSKGVKNLKNHRISNHHTFASKPVITFYCPVWPRVGYSQSRSLNSLSLKSFSTTTLLSEISFSQFLSSKSIKT